MLGPSRERHRGERHVLERGRGAGTHVTREMQHVRLAQTLDPTADLLRRHGPGRLPDHADHGGVVVTGECLERALEHEAADVVGEIASAEADRMGDAFAGCGEMAGDGLQARARRRGEPDTAARHRVGESERHAAEDCGAAIRPHHEEPARARESLQAHFVVHGDVVGAAVCQPRERGRL